MLGVAAGKLDDVLAEVGLDDLHPRGFECGVQADSSLAIDFDFATRRAPAARLIADDCLPGLGVARAEVDVAAARLEPAR